LSVLIGAGGESRIVTAEAVSSAPVGEAGFRLPADQPPDLIVLAFDPELVMWAATGGGLRGNGWTPENLVGLASDELAISEPCGSGSRPWAGGSG
jgi:hypothetical protein